MLSAGATNLDQNSTESPWSKFEAFEGEDGDLSSENFNP